jgi:hypothetical protein
MTNYYCNQSLNGGDAISKLVADFNSCFEEQILKLIGTGPVRFDLGARVTSQNADNRHPNWEKAAGVEGQRWMDVREVVNSVLIIWSC